MMAHAYQHKYRISDDRFRSMLSAVSVKNHANGFLNEKAQFRMQMTKKGVETSTMVADPLRLMDCSPITDGAACAILCPLELAKKKFKNHPIVKVIATGAATDTIALHSREDMAWLRGTEVRSQGSLQDGGTDSAQD